MIIKLELENIGPYSNKIVLDFRINKRDKDNLNSVYILPDGEMVTKIAGIIAGNAYGKTTIIDSLNSVGCFLSNPFKKKALEKYISAIRNIDSNDDLEQEMKSLGILSLLPTNKNEGIGTISVDMYIDTKDGHSGYYFYTLKYDNNYLSNGVIEESLKYKKRYNAKIEKVIFKTNDNSESEIGYKLAYKVNVLNDLDEKNKKNQEEKMVYYKTFYDRYIKESSTLDAENYVFPEDYLISLIEENSDYISKFISLVDNKIKKIKVDDNDKKHKKLLFIYDDYELNYNSISTATKKLFGVAVHFYKSILNGGVFTIDELDNSLNKNIAKFIIELYNRTIIDNTSQIIFTTNNAELLSNLRRDQIFIIEKSDNSNNIIKYLNFVDKDSNRKSRKDWSFTKVYNENIIKNYPTKIQMDNLKTFIKNNINKQEF